jgi:hypothetical protein
MATVLGWRGRVGQIGTRGVSALIQGGRRWVVERSHAWLNAFGQLGWCTERRGACVAFWPALAWVVRSSAAWSAVPGLTGPWVSG